MSKHRKKSRPARRSKRGGQPARIWQFEQLESRAMLAVMGPMPYDGGNYGPQIQRFAEPHPYHPAMSAPAHFEHHWAAGPEQHGWAFSRPMPGRFHEGRLVFREYDEPFEAWSIAPPNLQHSSYSQGPPPVVNFERKALDIPVWNSNIASLPNTNQQENIKISVVSYNPQRHADAPGSTSNQPDFALPGMHNTGYFDPAYYRLIGLSSASTIVTTQTTTRELE